VFRESDLSSYGLDKAVINSSKAARCVVLLDGVRQIGLFPTKSFHAGLRNEFGVRGRPLCCPAAKACFARVSPTFDALAAKLKEMKASLDGSHVLNVRLPASATTAQNDFVVSLGGFRN